MSTETIYLRVPLEIKQKVRRMSIKQDKTINDLVIHLIRKEDENVSLLEDTDNEPDDPNPKYGLRQL